MTSPSSAPPEPVLSADEVDLIDRYWRAANYLSVGQIYLLDNPLLREPLRPEHVKPRLLGHWGTTPGLNFIYAHLNRVIRARDLDVIYVCGPGHGGPGLVANTYLEGTYGEVYPGITSDADGMSRLFRQFSFPGGIPSHAAPETPGSIHEGGELGYALVHAYGAAFDNPGLVVACVIGDGEAETGPLAASWQSNAFLNPAFDGAVLPILHLNGYKIAGPPVMGRMGDDDLRALFTGLGYQPLFVEGDDPAAMHRLMAATRPHACSALAAIQAAARADPGRASGKPRWPLIVLRSPKGWTGPKTVDGKKVEGFWRAHQVPVDDARGDEGHRRILEDWMRGYAPEALFDGAGRLRPELAALAPSGPRRMGANPHANGGLLKRDLALPALADFAVEVPRPGGAIGEATRVLGAYLSRVIDLNRDARNFRVMGPDETASNRLDAVFEATDRVWMERVEPFDVHLAREGRVMEVLSEHLCQGWLEGYLLTGRHGLFSCYEAFAHIVDSMVNQHAKWLKVSRGLGWRRPIASLNYLLTSHVWRQDHNGFSHQDPGFIDHVANKHSDTVRIYLPPDANTLLAVTDHVLRTRNYINLTIAGKQPAPVFLEIEAAIRHVIAGVGEWQWASNLDEGEEPDVVIACAGDVPTLEALAAVTVLRDWAPGLKLRFVNVVDLFTLETPGEHPHGIQDEEFDRLFTVDKPIVFAFHGYPTIVHKLTYKRRNHDNMHVHGFLEQGTTTSPFDMTVLNKLDRYTLALDAITHVPRLAHLYTSAEQWHSEIIQKHKLYVSEYGEDMPEVRDWKWSPMQGSLAPAQQPV